MVTEAHFALNPNDPVARQAIARDAAWVSAGRDPGAGTRWASMSHRALMDLRRLMTPDGAPPAGAGAGWGFFWPRDGAFVAVALDRTGHPEEARRIIDFTARLPFDARRGFDARYQLGGGRVTQLARGPQSDGCGWVLWALGMIRAAGRTALPASAAGLRDNCVANLMALTRDGGRMPPPSPDYWEVPVGSTSLGTVAPMLAGLRAASADYAAEGRDVAARASSRAADRLGAQVTMAFAPTYQRFGDSGGMDAGVAILMPPFSAEASPAVVARWEAYQRDARRSSGGLAPGAQWKQDGTSWTPETALVAYTAAVSGRGGVAERWLDWLDQHRAAWGSLPEKVTRSGRTGGPAPLLWTVSLVLLTLSELQARGSAASPRGSAPTGASRM
jgi:GH15 family glucan-1,4-alpha-glucosidase